MNLPDPYIISLRNKIEEKLNFKINRLCDAKKFANILNENNLGISSHTIARLFGIIKPFRTPYKDTLNLLSSYLNYNDWDDFCTNQTNIPFDINYFLTEATDGFSLSVLQSALVNDDLESLSIILEKSSNTSNFKIMFSAAEMIGNYLRLSSKKQDLLKLLAKSNIGQLFFYECFVDENNKDGYFSEALIKYYLPEIKDDYKRLFVYCFNIGQKANKELKQSEYIPFFEKLIYSLDKRKCHYHELSRWLECSILIDGFNGVLHQTWKKHIYEIIEHAKLFDYQESCWIISRSLKALILFDLKKEIMHDLDFNECIDRLVLFQKKESHSIALYILQLYWIYKSKCLNSKIVYSPFRIDTLLFQNESDDKTVIELATASIFASGVNKIIMDNNLKTYCNKVGANWVKKLLFE